MDTHGRRTRAEKDDRFLSGKSQGDGTGGKHYGAEVSKSRVGPSSPAIDIRNKNKSKKVQKEE